MYDVLVSIRDPDVRDFLRAACAERGVFSAAAVARDRLPALLSPPSVVDVVILDLDPGAPVDREFLASLRAINSRVQFVAVAPGGDRSMFGPSRLQLDVRLFVRTPLEPFDLARRLKRLADSLAV